MSDWHVLKINQCIKLNYFYRHNLTECIAPSSSVNITRKEQKEKKHWTYPANKQPCCGENRVVLIKQSQISSRKHQLHGELSPVSWIPQMYCWYLQIFSPAVWRVYIWLRLYTAKIQPICIFLTYYCWCVIRFNLQCVKCSEIFKYSEVWHCFFHCTSLNTKKLQYIILFFMNCCFLFQK